MTSKQAEQLFIEPWIQPDFLRVAIGEISYNGILKDVAEAITELRKKIPKENGHD